MGREKKGVRWVRKMVGRGRKGWWKGRKGGVEQEGLGRVERGAEGGSGKGGK